MEYLVVRLRDIENIKQEIENNAISWYNHKHNLLLFQSKFPSVIFAFNQQQKKNEKYLLNNRKNTRYFIFIKLLTVLSLQYINCPFYFNKYNENKKHKKNMIYENSFSKQHNQK